MDSKLDYIFFVLAIMDLNNGFIHFRLKEKEDKIFTLSLKGGSGFRSTRKPPCRIPAPLLLVDSLSDFKTLEVAFIHRNNFIKPSSIGINILKQYETDDDILSYVDINDIKNVISHIDDCGEFYIDTY